jgi:hypothetical protein
VRRDSFAVEQISTDALIDHVSDLICTDQIAVEGVEPPCKEGWAACHPWKISAPTSMWGILPGSNIGYIYIYSWVDKGEQFLRAVNALRNTDGLIFDQRGGVGGSLNGVYLPFGDEPLPQLTNASRQSPDDYLALDNPLSSYGIEYGPSGSFYNHSIAVLTGPHMGSAGDLFPYIMSFRPRARRFGRTTDGRFSVHGVTVWPKPVPEGPESPDEDAGSDGNSYSWTLEWDPYTRDLRAGVTGSVFLDEDGNSLFGSIQQPETPVWLTVDDIAAGKDTVVKAALAWIE